MAFIMRVRAFTAHYANTCPPKDKVPSREIDAWCLKLCSQALRILWHGDEVVPTMQVPDWKAT